LWLNHVRFFKPEAATLQTAKQRFNLPALRIIAKRLLAILRGDHNQILATFEPHPRHKQFQPPDQSGFLKAQGLIDGLLAKQSPCRYHLSAPVRHLGILANPDTKRDMVGLQPLEPSFANKLAVGAQIQDRIDAKQGNKLSQDGLALGGVGIAFLLQDRPQHRNGYALVNQAQHQNIQRRLAELPVAAVQSQHPRTRHAAKRNEQDRDDGVTDFKEAQEALNAFVVRFFLGATGKYRGNLGEVDTANLDQSNDKLGQEVDSSLVPIYIFSKGSLKRANRGHRAFSSQVITILGKDKAAMAFYAFSNIFFVLY